MKLVIFTMLSLVTFTSIGQENTTKTLANVDSLSQKVESLQKRVDAQQEQLGDLKHENKLLRKEVSRNNLFRRGFGTRSRVVVDRRGSKQAHVVYY